MIRNVDSHLTDWTVVQRTPYGKDVLAMLAAECHKQASSYFFTTHIGLAFAGLFSAWTYGHRTGRPEAGNWTLT